MSDFEETSEKQGQLETLREVATGRPLFLAIMLVGLTCIGFYLRYTYARSSSPYIDEYTTMWVALRTLRFGYPVFSTGALYGQGVLLSYLVAAVFRLFGFGEFIARTPILVVSVLSIPLLFVVGKRLFSARAGLIAAALLAFDPQAIIWGGRARGYSLLLFLVALMVLFAYKGVIAGDKALYRRLLLLVVVTAVYVHIGAALFFPAVVFLALLWRGWRWLLRPAVLAELLLAMMGLASSYHFYRLMQPEGWTSLGEGRPALAPSLNILGAARRYGPFFVGPDQLPFVVVITLFMLAGFAFCLLQVWRSRGNRIRLLEGEDAGLAFLCVTFLFMMTEMIFLVGERRWSTRYLFMIVPIFFLMASSMVVKVLDLGTGWLEEGRLRSPLFSIFRSSHAGSSVLAGFVAVLIAFFALPTSLGAANSQELGYDLAFRYVGEHRREGDEVMSFDLSACMLYLNEDCDYVAVENDFHAYATKKGEYWIGAWGDVPILFTDQALRRAIDEADRMWFVVDERRFRSRYTADFIQYVWDRMELVTKERGVFVFLSENPPPVVLTIDRPVFYNLDEKVALLGHALSDDVLAAGGVLCLEMRWQGLTHILQSYSAFVHLVDAQGRMWAQHDGAPLNGLHPTTHWVEGEIISDPRELVLPQDMPEGRYRLQAGMYLPETMEHLPVLGAEGQPLGDSAILDYVRVERGSPVLPVPEQVAAFSFDGAVRLWGYDLTPQMAEPGDTVRVALYWRAERQVEEDYTVFVHLVDEEGEIWGQQDNEPEGGFYHTSFWDVGETLTDRYEFVIDQNTPPGEYRIEIGMYVLETGQRLPVVDERTQTADDKAVLGTVAVE
ncbi:MAG TPA: glycosyltransferase family 39 protein [Anaerolineae bacterium]|nr:glycosyltransferase family 39 protein [Anaerolineae bacterium]